MLDSLDNKKANLLAGNPASRLARKNICQKPAT